MSDRSLRAKYETAVAGLASAAALKLESGASEEDVARGVVAEGEAAAGPHAGASPALGVARQLA